MSKTVDARGMLEEKPFAYTAAKDGKVFISWNGRRVMILQGEQAKRFLQKVEGADSRQAQLAMAKVTGNFKRGNEKAAKKGE